MPATRRRRIVRRAVMSLAGVVLLVSGYVSSYCGVWWMGQNGLISLPTLDVALTTIYQPITRYVGTDSPGSEYIVRLRSLFTEDARVRNARVRSAERAAAEDEVPQQ